jgi:DNA-binding transcriptional ArsR family regulator
VRRAAQIGAALGAPARARMLLQLLDGRPRSSTELAAVGGVTAATASAHLRRLLAARLVEAAAEGRHRYYRLRGPETGALLEALCTAAGGAAGGLAPAAPSELRAARSCYDHLAGILGVRLHERLQGLGWLQRCGGWDFAVTAAGESGLASLGVDVAAARAGRRRFAFGCLDWTERRWHLAGALGAEVLALALRRGWVRRELETRALAVTGAGRRALAARLGMEA